MDAARKEITDWRKKNPRVDGDKGKATGKKRRIKARKGTERRLDFSDSLSPADAAREKAAKLPEVLLVMQDVHSNPTRFLHGFGGLFPADAPAVLQHRRLSRRLEKPSSGPKWLAWWLQL